jgi:hypothetical protein
MEEERPSQSQLIWLVRRELEWAYAAYAADAADADHPLRFDVGAMAGI